MRLPLGLAVFALSCATHAASSAFGHVYFSDPESLRRRPTSQVVSPGTARVIFAERLGLAQFHTLHTVDHEVLKQVNDYGGRTRRLFQDGSGLPRARPQMIVIVEGVVDPRDIVGHNRDFHLAISSPPDSPANGRMLEDLAAQAESLLDPTSSLKADIEGADVVELREALHVGKRSFTTRNGISFIHFTLLEDIITDQGQKSAAYKQEASRISQILQKALSHGNVDGPDMTLILMPPQTRQGKGTSNPYGIYQTPSRRPKAQRQVEDPLLTFSHTSSSIDPNSTSSTAHNLANSTIPAGILPPCFSTLSSCQATTKNCTGHGSCELKYVNKDQNDAACYTCMCKADVRTNEDGTKKTTMWGGSACQKKNVVMPFWLLGGFTVVMVFVVSWGIGLLYQMGQEDLPSVIGAGVAGPRATK